MDDLKNIVLLLSWVDYLGIALFFSCWMGYRFVLERGEIGRKGLIGITHEYRLQWAMESAAREIPVACAGLTSNLMASVSFYASTTIYIIAGLFALVGSVERLLSFSEDMPFAQAVSSGLIELKLILLIFIFVNAYFKFTWSLRQFNFLCILIGGSPYHGNMPSEEYRVKTAKRMARVNSCAGNEFNRGIRSYYYGIAASTWFLHPVAFIVATIWVTYILYVRDFHSPVLEILRDTYPPELRNYTQGSDEKGVNNQEGSVQQPSR
ncbi:DUF599 domain-containing protein [Paraglaciecola chathamensis]|jgi:uncharacterized membrane protein|uniref:DUF599 domain-containing protein n=1 Tax=Paraglaciecola chathamensis TaxID=368405 RepID=A0ABS0WIM3_9ALTE|nr:DUF599 domain-containing protein [Paraglaciecola chathamensis]MBJ2138319.1 DUF599 domain-containing protein [Paraglaciecola chathamensis]